MSCESAVYAVQVECCRDITIKAGLIAGSSYDVVLTRPGSSIKRRRSYTAASDGSILLQKTRYPAGAFGTGYLEMVVREMVSAVTLTISGNEYKSIMLQLVKADGNYSNIIG